MELLDYTLGEALEKWAINTPEKEFIAYPDRSLRFSYFAFNERVDRLAKGLLYIGVNKGDKVGILAKNVPDWTTFMFATAKIGAVLVPINTGFKSSELEFILKDADIKVLCVAEGHKDHSFVPQLLDLVPEIKLHPRGELLSEKLPYLTSVIYIGQQKHKGMFSIQELMLLGEHIDNIELESIRESLTCHDVVLMQYTSGTTGSPKGVMLSHYNILNNGYSVGECMKFSSSEKLLLCVPLFNSFGSVLGVCSIVTHGATLVITEQFDPLLVLASIQKEKCTAIYGVPTMFIEILESPMFDVFNLSSLRTGIMSGAPCPIELMNKVMGQMHCRDIIIVYGLTEASPAMTATRCHNSAELRSSTIGFELPNVEVKIINPDNGEECAIGEEGEICCKGYNLMKGYYQNEKASKKAFNIDGWLLSGDLAVKNEDGFYKITGRIKETILRGGESIHPKPIEEFLLKMPQIESVEVAGIPSPKYGEQVGAFIILKKGESLSEEEVQEFCKNKIATIKIPKYIFFVEEFPTADMSRAQKFKLADFAMKTLYESGEKVI